MFGAQQSMLEALMLKRRILGPCWLDLSRPNRIPSASQVYLDHLQYVLTLPLLIPQKLRDWQACAVRAYTAHNKHMNFVVVQQHISPFVHSQGRVGPCKRHADLRTLWGCASFQLRINTSWPFPGLSYFDITQDLWWVGSMMGTCWNILSAQSCLNA